MGANSIAILHYFHAKKIATNLRTTREARVIFLWAASRNPAAEKCTWTVTLSEEDHVSFLHVDSLERETSWDLHGAKFDFVGTAALIGKFHKDYIVVSRGQMNYG